MRSPAINTERREAVKEIIAHLSIPRSYAGDWSGDVADRIIKALDVVGEYHVLTPTASVDVQATNERVQIVLDGRSYAEWVITHAEARAVAAGILDVLGD